MSSQAFPGWIPILGTPSRVTANYQEDGSVSIDLDATVSSLIDSVAVEVSNVSSAMEQAALEVAHGNGYVPTLATAAANDNRGRFNVLNYGADPSGVADSYAAFAAAMSDAVDGDEIIVPFGTYTLSETLVVTKALRFSGTQSSHTTYGTKLRPSVSFTGAYLIHIQRDGVQFLDFIVWGRENPTVVNGIYVYKSGDWISGVTLENLFIAQVNGIGIHLQFSGMCSLKNVRSSTGQIKITGGSTSIHLLSCYALSCDSHGFYVEGSRYISFVSCGADSNGGYGYYVYTSAENVSFSGCGAEANYHAGWWLRGDANTINACFGYHNGTGADTTNHPASGVLVNGAGNAIVSYCEFADASEIGDILANILLIGTNNSVVGGKFERGESTDGVLNRGTGNSLVSTVVVSGGNSHPGTVSLHEVDGTKHYLWVDTGGNLRIGTSSPTYTTSDSIGTVVGTQS